MEPPFSLSVQWTAVIDSTEWMFCSISALIPTKRLPHPGWNGRAGLTLWYQVSPPSLSSFDSHLVAPACPACIYNTIPQQSIIDHSIPQAPAEATMSTLEVMWCRREMKLHCLLDQQCNCPEDEWENKEIPDILVSVSECKIQTRTGQVDKQ